MPNMHIGLRPRCHSNAFHFISTPQTSHNTLLHSTSSCQEREAPSKKDKCYDKAVKFAWKTGLIVPQSMHAMGFMGHGAINSTHQQVVQYHITKLSKAMQKRDAIP